MKTTQHFVYATSDVRDIQRFPDTNEFEVNLSTPYERVTEIGLQSIDLNPSNQTITKGVNDKLFFGEGFRFGSEDVQSVQFSIGGQDVLVPRFLNPVVQVTADTVHCQFPIKLWNSYLLASSPSWVSLPSNMTLETPTSFKPSPMPTFDVHSFVVTPTLSPQNLMDCINGQLRGIRLHCDNQGKFYWSSRTPATLHFEHSRYHPMAVLGFYDGQSTDRFGHLKAQSLPTTVYEATLPPFQSPSRTDPMPCVYQTLQAMQFGCLQAYQRPPSGTNMVSHVLPKSPAAVSVGVYIDAGGKSSVVSASAPRWYRSPYHLRDELDSLMIPAVEWMSSNKFKWTHPEAFHLSFDPVLVPDGLSTFASLLGFRSRTYTATFTGHHYELVSEVTVQWPKVYRTFSAHSVTRTVGEGFTINEDSGTKYMFPRQAYAIDVSEEPRRLSFRSHPIQLVDATTLGINNNNIQDPDGLVHPYVDIGDLLNLVLADLSSITVMVERVDGTTVTLFKTTSKTQGLKSLTVLSTHTFELYPVSSIKSILGLNRYLSNSSYYVMSQQFDVVGEYGFYVVVDNFVNVHRTSQLLLSENEQQHVLCKCTFTAPFQFDRGQSNILHFTQPTTVSKIRLKLVQEDGRRLFQTNGQKIYICFMVVTVS